MFLNSHYLILSSPDSLPDSSQAKLDTATREEHNGQRML